MCTEIGQFSSFLRRMSGSDSPQIFPVEKKEEIIVSSESHPAEERERQNLEADHQKEPDEEIKSDEDDNDKATVSHRESEVDEEDGFKTPTSSDHRIPAITQCPPAPKKLPPPPSKLKRKAASPPGSSRSIQLDSSAEVELIFCPIAKDQDDTQQQKIKKARTDD